jgi:16S rRNA (guanine527-N7)-methyltransferase
LAKERESLTAGLFKLGIEPRAETIAAFGIYRMELQKWNKVHNITSITDDNEIVVKHFLDSLLYLKVFPTGQHTLCDVGSGGGFPGLPIAIVRPEINVSLIEPSRKRVAFLRQMRRLLSLANVEVIDCRAEELVESEFDVVVTRATFSIADMLEKAGHLIKKGGLLVMSKGPKYEEEIRALPAGFSAGISQAELGADEITRNLIAIRRTQ